MVAEVSAEIGGQLVEPLVVHHDKDEAVDVLVDRHMLQDLLKVLLQRADGRQFRAIDDACLQGAVDFQPRDGGRQGTEA